MIQFYLVWLYLWKASEECMWGKEKNPDAWAYSGSTRIQWAAGQKPFCTVRQCI